MYRDDATTLDQVDNSSIEQQCRALGIDLLTLGEIQTESMTADSELAPWILHIEDDTDFATAFRLRMKTFGYQVISAVNGADGVRASITRPAEAVVVDFHLPNGNGDFVLRRVKSNPITESIPVVFLSAVASTDIRHEMINRGASGFLSKPPDYEALVRLLRQQIK